MIYKIAKPKLKRVSDAPMTLKEMQDFVGGLIEVVYLGDDQLVVNEEGLLLGLPYNSEASELSGRRIVGDALLLSGEGRMK